MAEADQSAEVQDVDVVVLGLGNGGEGILTHLAGSGLTVVGIEQHLAGGECPFYACVPTKMIRHEASQPQPDWARVARRIREEAAHDWDDTEIVENLRATGAEIVRGTGWFTGSRTVEVTAHPDDDAPVRSFRARRAVVLGVGAESIIPEFEGAEEIGVWTHRDITTAEALPQRLAVVGGAVIACELSQALARFGVEVTMLVRSTLMSGEEPAVGEHLLEVLRSEGVDVRLETEVSSAVRQEDGSLSIRLSSGETLEADELLAATGRKPRIDVETDEYCRVLQDSEPSDWLYAVGDLTGHGDFTHVAVREGEVAARMILATGAGAGSGSGADAGAASGSAAGAGADAAEARAAVEPVAVHAVPRVTFTSPEIAGVGLTAAAARKQAEDQPDDTRWDVVSVTKDLNENARGWIDEAHGNITLVADRRTGLLLGASLIGPGAGEIVGALTVAVHQRMTVQELSRVMWAYPTLHRVISDAIGELDLS